MQRWSRSEFDEFKWCSGDLPSLQVEFIQISLVHLFGCVLRLRGDRHVNEQPDNIQQSKVWWPAASPSLVSLDFNCKIPRIVEKKTRDEFIWYLVRMFVPEAACAQTTLFKTFLI